jgi:hypothetical protein
VKENGGYVQYGPDLQERNEFPVEIAYTTDYPMMRLSSRMRRAAFSPIIYAGAWVCPLFSLGMMDASAIPITSAILVKRGETQQEGRRKKRRTGDAQAFDASHSESRIDNGLLVLTRTHLARASRMVTCPCLLPHIFLPFLIAIWVNAGGRPCTRNMIPCPCAFGDDLVHVAAALG